LLELKWIESFEREESTQYNYVRPSRETRHWRTTWFRLTTMGKQFLELFPQDLAIAQAEYEDLPTPEEQAANWEAYKKGEWNLPTDEI
jgi:hypothetical protein